MDLQFLGGSGAGSGRKKGGGTTSASFEATDDGPFRQMTDNEENVYFNKQTFSQQQQEAIDRYIDPNIEPWSLYSFSQNMNQAYMNGLPLTQIQKDTLDMLVSAMHNIGYNAELTRYDHANSVQILMKHAGITGSAANISVKKLQGLIGQTFTEKRILSTSVNSFKNAKDPSAFTTRQYKYTIRAKASTQGFMPGISKIPYKYAGTSTGDNFGEMLLSPSNTYKVVEIKYSGAKARPKGMPKTYLTKKQIEIVLEVV